MKFNGIKKWVGLIALVISTISFAQTSKYKTMIQMQNYTGKEAYLVISLINPNGQYEKTLGILGKDNEWYNTLKEWDKFNKKKKEKLNGITPNTIEDLIKFNGVGRKTANLTLAKGYNIPAICVDVHVHRISNRIGWVKTSMPDDTELELRKILPQKFWLDINTLLVTLGQNICRPSKPKCTECPINEYCQKLI